MGAFAVDEQALREANARCGWTELHSCAAQGLLTEAARTLDAGANLETRSVGGMDAALRHRGRGADAGPRPAPRPGG